MSSSATNAIAPANLKDMRLFREACYVDGQWVQASSGSTCNVDNPATGEIIGHVPKLNGAETRHAIEAADRGSVVGVVNVDLTYRLSSQYDVLAYGQWWNQHEMLVHHTDPQGYGVAWTGDMGQLAVDQDLAAIAVQ